LTTVEKKKARPVGKIALQVAIDTRTGARRREPLLQSGEDLGFPDWYLRKIRSFLRQRKEESAERLANAGSPS
jgi:hypothetical protein